jgi:leucyl-tRNA synthetase
VRSDEVSDTFLDSAWYFLRYPSTRSARSGQTPWDPKITKRWLPVDMYIGGAEHSVLHLLYSRFLTMVFYDLGLTHFEEPFTRFRAHGLLIKEGAKMSKSRGNIVVPDNYIKAYGADTLRTYLMFIGPFDRGGNFQDKGIAGVARFLKRVWRLTCQAKGVKTKTPNPDFVRTWHETIKKVSEQIERLKFNTAIAAMMEFVNSWETNKSKADKEVAKTFLKLLAPFAPHLTEELWVNVLREKFSIHRSAWPAFDPQLISKTVFSIAILINGKVRDQMEVTDTASQKEVVEIALRRPKIKKWLEGPPRRTVYVPGRVLNLVT